MSKRVSLAPQEFAEYVKGLIREAQSAGVILRAMGAVAIYIRVMGDQPCLDLYRAIGRFSDKEFAFTDLDLVGLKKQKSLIERFFAERGFKPDYYVNAFFSDRRLIFSHPENLFSLDVFFSPLEFSHVVDLGKDPESTRLLLEDITLSPADLLLLKLQIHDINRKDLADMAVLLACHETSLSDEPGRLNARRIGEVLADDWGFWYDATNNMNALRQFIGEYVSRADFADHRQLLERALKNLDFIAKTVDETPKTKDWLKRAKIGTKKRWYNVVEEV
ncbi:hypothetical protein [Infirmifilum sp. NZ]|uniref:hypothetical protein n=1 Tax=Infirmifilum sp. NZ TaxID=2926850 RepID=UPI00279A3F18|nr:hypothetical protein [Infirmifilum sp. NZ]UNQ73738.1 hypothetical protein MOV14_01680 [Infirmifilum sp. NZ]